MSPINLLLKVKKSVQELGGGWVGGDMQSDDHMAGHNGYHKW